MYKISIVAWLELMPYETSIVTGYAARIQIRVSVSSGYGYGDTDFIEKPDT
jgi:hypothetical protein